MTSNLHVVISRGQSEHPDKRGLEQAIADELRSLAEVSVTVVPHLYDLAPEGDAIRALRQMREDLVVCSWLYERAARWVLDRNGIRGLAGQTELVDEAHEDEDEAVAEPAEEAAKPRVQDQRHVPPRRIYCLDLRLRPQAVDFVAEIRRLAAERASEGQLTGWLKGSATAEQTRRFLEPTNDTALGGSPPAASPEAGTSVRRVEEVNGRRWYPVIDFSRCTNCMECIDFCLFGVYGVDGLDTILVEQPDNCRKGCPACSRVCPENAIIFPQHKTPAIAGAPTATGGLKIDLSQLFGAPSAIDVAAQERDEQLLLAGRETVGKSVGVPKRQEARQAASKDELDGLLDELEEFDL